MKLTKKQSEVLINNAIKLGNRGRIIGANANKRKKEERIDFYNKSAKKDVGIISRRELFMVGVALYWAEGSKTDKFSFSNSDPDMILFCVCGLRWLWALKRRNLCQEFLSMTSIDLALKSAKVLVGVAQLTH